MGEEVYCSIGQASEMLGISRDTIKFYEEKGLLEPIKDEENGYRKYSIEGIHNLYLINFYRELGIELKRIKEIKDCSELNHVGMILEEQEKKLSLELSNMKKLFNKVKKTRSDYLNVVENIDKFSIRSLGPFKVLREITETAIEDANTVVLKYKESVEENGLSNRAHTLDNLLKEFSFNKEGIVGEKHLVIKKARKKTGNLFYKECLYTVLKIPVVGTEEEGEKVFSDNYNLFMKECFKREIEPLGKVYLKMVLGVFEDNKEFMYLEGFLPVEIKN